IQLPAGAIFEEPVGSDRSAMLVVYEGELGFTDGTRVRALGAAFLDAGDKVRFQAAKPSRGLLIAGRPIGEPVARGGPFVMNTREEVEKAAADFQAGLF